MTTIGATREQLVRRLLARRASEATVRIPPAPTGATVPLTPAQARIWFFTRLYPDSTEYNVFDTVHLDTTPDDARLAGALRTLVERHDALRLRIFEVDGEPVQQDAGPYTPDVESHDLTGHSAEAADERAREIANACARRLLRPDEPPLCRFSLITLPGGHAILVMVVHHLVADHWSWSFLLRDLSALLSGLPLADAEPVRFIDYAAWAHRSVDQLRIETETAYWRDKLGGELPVLDLPKDRPRPTVSSRRGHAVPVRVPDDVADRARRLAGERGTTLFVVMLAAYQAFLLRLTGQRDLVIGTALAGRDHPVTERIVGCFVKAVALRTELAGELSYVDSVDRVHDTVLGAQDHQTVPYDEVVANLDIARDLAVQPVFQTYFGLQTAETTTLPGARTESFSLFDYGSAKWDLTVSLTDGPDGLDGVMECSADLFDASTLTRFARMFVRLLAALSAEPDVSIEAHSLTSADEREHILHGLNPYQRPTQPYRTLAQPFEEQAQRTPQAVALVGEEGELTYGELNARANQLAHFLREAGAGSGTRIALCLDRGFAMVTAIHAVAKTGATYVPLDPELPDGRLEFMLADTGPLVVLADRNTRSRVPEGAWQVFDVAADAHRWAGLPRTNVDIDVPEGGCSHLLYTSGSTGRPKAVACAVDGSIADIRWMQSRYPYRPGDTALCKTSYGFDVSLWELCWPLYFGARLAVCRAGGHRDVHYLADMIDRYRVSAVYLIPTQLQVFLDELPEGRCGSLRWMLSGGEPVTPRLRDTCHARLAAPLVNGYGPTETGRATDMILPREPGVPVVPLGRPSTNFRVYVLDDRLRVLPIGVPGEAYLAAEIGISHGYHNRPELTAERYLPDPFGPPGARMYRTGDVCRYREDGTLEHLGRIGRQVKVRGMRIEPAEVEAVLCEHEQVADCVTLAVRHNGGQELVAFVVPTPGAEPGLTALREHAAALLPRHMLPAWLQPVPEIPVNVNGKTDHQALLRQWSGAGGVPDRELVPPANDREATLAGIFGRVLGVGEISMTDSFFSLGGHSLLVFKLIAACATELGVRPDVADVFAAPTVRDLAARLRDSGGGQGRCLVPLAPAAGRPLVVFVHAAGGSVFPFRAVARRLAGDFSVYAMQSPGPEVEHESIVDLATRYVGELDEVRGLSPVAVVGWSMGGCVALEMTRTWRERGVSPAATVLLDSWPPPATLRSPVLRDRSRDYISGLDICAVEGIDVTAADAELERLTRVADRNRAAYLDYRPDRFDGRVHLLRATEGPSATAGFAPGDWTNWRSVVGDLVGHEIAGSHFSLLADEHADALAATVRGLVDADTSFAEI